MAKKIGQVRWFKNNSTDNWPQEITLDKFRAGTIFPRSYPIVFIRVETLPGT